MNSNNNIHKTPITATTNSTTECPNCNSAVDNPCLLHHVKHRGLFRRLCTSCVLKLHPGSFCPTCFELIDTSTPTHLRVCCQKCHSISHSSCIAGSVDGGSYTCPPCSSPSFSFFEIKKSGENGGVKVIDKQAATVLLCAARIAAVSMNKAMGFARSEAERRVREATLSKKRAREAFERITSLAGTEKGRNGSSSVPAQGKGKASRINNGSDVGSVAKHDRVDTKVKVSASRDKESATREPKMKFDVKGSSSSTMAGETTDKLENKTISITAIEKGGNGMLPLPLPPPTHVKVSLLPKETSNSDNAVVKKGSNGTMFSSNPVVEKNSSSKEANVDVDEPKSGLSPPNPDEEMKLTPPKENYSQDVKTKKVDKALLPPVPAKEDESPSLRPGPVTNIDSNPAEVEMAEKEILPPNPVKDSQLPLQGTSANPNPAPEKANHAVLPSRPDQETKVSSPKENNSSSSYHDDNAEPTEKADGLLLPPHPIDDDKAPPIAVTTVSCDTMEDDDTTPK